MTEVGAREDQRSGAAQKQSWYQVIPSGKPVEVCSSTRFGINPLNDDREGRYRFPNRNVSGLALISELSVVRDTWDGSDIAVTAQMAGYHPPDSVLYPEPFLLISPRLRSLFQEHQVKGVRFEVAHLK
jgi:hypothetical protein